MRRRTSCTKRWGRGLAFFLFAAPVVADDSPELEVFSVFQTDLFSEPEPIRTAFKKWGSRFSDGERQWAIAKLEVGGRYRGFELSLQQRYLADLQFTPEAAQFYGRLARRDSLTPGASAPVYVEINSFSGQGLRFGYVHEANNWSLGGGATVLYTRHLMSGALEGEFTALSEESYSLDAVVDYYYYTDPVFKRPDIDEAEGAGWTFDLKGKWQVTDRLHLAAQAEDLFAKIQWKDVPYTRARAQTDRRRYDEEGFAIFDPLVAGQEGYEDGFSQELDPRYQVDAELAFGRWSAYLQGRHQFSYDFGGIGAGYALDSDVQLRAMAWPSLNAYGLQLDRRELTLALALSLDEVSVNGLHYLKLDISYNY